MRKDLNILDFLAQVPWWLYVASSAICYIILQFVIPHFQAQGILVNEVNVSLGPVLAPVVAVALLSPVSISFLKRNRRQKLHELRDKIKSIQELSWPQFRELTAEAYRRSGYLILDSGPYVDDPSIDLVMRKSANLYFVQARYWCNRKIGLREVKKLFSLMQEKHASGVFLLTTGIFTREARSYAVGRPITLVNGIQLVELLADIKNKNLKHTPAH